MKRFFSIVVFYLAITYPLSGFSRTIQVDLQNTPAASGSAAVLNLSSHTIHLPLVVDRSEGAGGGATGGIDEDDAVDIGRGTDGIFSSSTQSQWDKNGGVSSTQVTLDTAHTYEFVSFTLNEGVTLYGTGSNPLVLKVQGDVTINGTIDLSGSNGSFSSSSAASGGSACCGGAQGGAAGNLAGTVNGTSGSSVSGLGGGGTGGTAGNPANGGGGGGYTNNGSAGSGGTAGGSNYGDDYISTLYGGSGGGGGGAQTTGGFYGASGGGGGGAIQIQAGGKIILGTNGKILANGGNGGAAAGGSQAGDGGAGAGGAILLYSGSTTEIAGMLRALGGTGTSGGDGSLGRIRYCTSIGDITALTGVPDNPPPNLAPFGQTFYTLNASTVTSAVYDSGNSSPTYNSYQATQNVPAGSTLTLEFAGSSDGFVQDDTGWKSTAQLSQLEGKRYYRFRASLRTADRTETPVLSALSFDVTDRIQPTFNFNIGSCAGVQSTGSPSHPIYISILFLIWLATTLRYARRVMC